MRSLIGIFLFSLVFLVGCKSGDTKPDNLVSYNIETDRGTLFITEKTERSMRFFSVTKTQDAKGLVDSLPALAEQIATDAIKRAKLEINGPLTLVFQNLPAMKGGPLTAAIGFPIKGRGNKLPKYQIEKKSAFKCLSLPLPKADVETSAYWETLYELAAKQGYSLSGESRTVISEHGDGFKAELQLGVL